MVYRLQSSSILASLNIGFASTFLEVDKLVESFPVQQFWCIGIP